MCRPQRLELSRPLGKNLPRSLKPLAVAMQICGDVLSMDPSPFFHLFSPSPFPAFAFHPPSTHVGTVLARPCFRWWGWAAGSPRCPRPIPAESHASQTGRDALTSEVFLRTASSSSHATCEGRMPSGFSFRGSCEPRCPP